MTFSNFLESNITNVIVLIFVIVISISFLSKTREKSKETKIFSSILYMTILELIAISISSIIKDDAANNLLLYEYSNRFILMFHALWPCLFTIYVYILASKNDGIKLFKNEIKGEFVCTIVLIISSLVYFLPIEFIESDNMLIPSGLSVYYVYFIVFALILIMLFILLMDNKNLKSKKYLPLYLFLAFSLVASIIQYINPRLLLSTSVHAIVILVMYITIENPDARIAEVEKKAKSVAEAASLAKSEFLSSMSHELRTPLNAIVGLSEDIESFNDKVPKEVREDTVDIVNASNTLLEIIGSILDISKIESGKLDIVESDYAPKEEFESISKILRTKASEKNLEFNVSISEKIPDVLFGDRLRIKQIINNLLSNAIKYTDHGRVNFFVNWLDASGALSITVADTGRGVKEEDMDKLFSKYDRLGVEKTSNVQGTGLGLAITKTLIDLMGGTVEVKSEYLIGTTFSVTIPQKLGDAERLESIKMAQLYVPKDLDFKGKRLLVVDDNLLNIKVFKKAVKDFNFEIDECYNGQEALDKIELNNNYDIIFMDIKMPVMDGEEAIGHLTNMPNFKTPVVALTADAMTGSNNKYLNMGFSDYMSKPFSRKVIAVKLDTILNKGEVANKNINSEEEKKEETSTEEIKES